AGAHGVGGGLARTGARRDRARWQAPHGGNAPQAPLPVRCGIAAFLARAARYLIGGGTVTVGTLTVTVTTRVETGAAEGGAGATDATGVFTAPTVPATSATG